MGVSSSDSHHQHNYSTVLETFVICQNFVSFFGFLKVQHFSHAVNLTSIITSHSQGTAGVKQCLPSMSLSVCMSLAEFKNILQADYCFQKYGESDRSVPSVFSVVRTYMEINPYLAMHKSVHSGAHGLLV